jgi:hypothetical protein
MWMADIYNRKGLLKFLRIRDLRESFVYGDTCKIAMLKGDEVRVKAFAEKYLEAQAACFGSNSRELKVAKWYVEQPSRCLTDEEKKAFESLADDEKV